MLLQKVLTIYYTNEKYYYVRYYNKTKCLTTVKLPAFYILIDYGVIIGTNLFDAVQLTLFTKKLLALSQTRNSNEH